MSVPPATLNTERLPLAIKERQQFQLDVSDIQKISKAISPQLFSLKNDMEVFTLMMLGQADGIHPITALRRYHIIEGKPSMKSDAMLACFFEAGGRVKWLVRSDTQVKAEFCVDDDCVTIDWNIERAKKAGLAGRKNWLTYPCQMLTARVISEGIRLVMPQIVTGIYTPEEVQDFTPGPNEKTWGSKDQPLPQAETVTPVIDAPVVPSLTNEEREEKKKNLGAWVLDFLNPETFQRNSETEDFANIKAQIIRDSVGLSEDEVMNLRKNAYYQWVACMICTSSKEELASTKWSSVIDKAPLEEQMKIALRKSIADNIVMMAKEAA